MSSNSANNRRESAKKGAVKHLEQIGTKQSENNFADTA